MRALRGYLGLSSFERRLLMEALALLPLVRVSVSTAGYRATAAWLGTLVAVIPRSSGAQPREALCEAAGRMVRTAAAHGLVGASCLPQSLVLWTLVRSRGFDATLRFGVRRTEGGVEAHAWVETGEIVWDPAGLTSSGFVPLTESTGSWNCTG